MDTPTNVITQFDKATVSALGAEAMSELREFAARHGLSMRFRGGSFEDGSFTMRLQFGVGDMDPEEADFLRYAERYSELSQDDLHKTFTHRRHTYEIVGFRHGTARPVVVKRGDGKRFLFRAEVVKQALGG